MLIKTESIKKDIMDFTGKEIADITEEDILKIDFLTVKRFINEEFVPIDYKELLYFQNLKTLEFDSVIFENDIVEILNKIETLETLIFRKCEFIDSLEDFNKLYNIKALTIVASTNFRLEVLSDMQNIEKLVMNSIDIENIDFLSSLNLNCLDLKRSSITNPFNIDAINCRELVIPIDMYNMYKEEFDKFTGKLVVIGTNGIYPEFERGV